MGQVEVFTPLGVVSGDTLDTVLAGDGLGCASAIPIDASLWYPLDGSPSERHADTIVDADDVLIVVWGGPPAVVHSGWYAVELDVGPYRVDGHLSTAPGFDPGRALSRPNGPFVALRDVVIRVPGRVDAGLAEREYAYVNRYAVERVRSSLMLGHFFPGATLESVIDTEANAPRFVRHEDAAPV